MHFSASYSKQNRQDHHSSRSQRWSFPRYVDWNISWDFLRGSARQFSSPFCPYIWAKYSELVRVRLVAWKSEVYMTHESDRCCGNDRFRPVLPPSGHNFRGTRVSPDSAQSKQAEVRFFFCLFVSSKTHMSKSRPANEFSKALGMIFH